MAALGRASGWPGCGATLLSHSHVSISVRPYDWAILGEIRARPASRAMTRRLPMRKLALLLLLCAPLAARAHEPHVCGPDIPDTPVLAGHLEHADIVAGAIEFPAALRGGPRALCRPVQRLRWSGAPGGHRHRRQAPGRATRVHPHVLAGGQLLSWLPRAAAGRRRRRLRRQRLCPGAGARPGDGIDLERVQQRAQHARHVRLRRHRHAGAGDERRSAGPGGGAGGRHAHPDAPRESISRSRSPAAWWSTAAAWTPIW